MRKLLSILALVSLFVAGFVAAQQTGKGLLEQGRARKTAGDLQGAMESFETVVADFAAADRNAAANALIELGGIADSLGQLTRARTYYERVRNDFKDQAAEVALASNRLSNQSAPAVGRSSAGAGGSARVTIRTPFTEDVYGFALSPDGKTLVFQGTSQDGKRQLWRQAVDASAKPEPIAGTDGAGASAFPFFSPDGKSVGYFAKQKFWQIDLAGGVAKELAEASFSWGGTWSGDSIVVSARGSGGPIEMLKDGRFSAVTPSGALVSPHFLDDRKFLYFARDARGSGTIEVSSIDGQATAKGLPAAQAASFTSGFLVYATPAGSLNALRFDPKEMTASGSALVVADKVGTERRYPGFGAFTVSASGPVAYREKSVVNRQMLWMDRTGELLGTVGAVDDAAPGNPRVSPDGKFVLHFRQTGSPLGSIWVTDATTGAQRQLQNNANIAVWSPAGERILFAALTGGGGRGRGGGGPGPLMIARPITAAEGSGAGVSVGPTSGMAYPEDWASTGAVVYRAGQGSGMGGGDLFAVREGQTVPIPVAGTLATEKNARFSPDGKWIAYQSDEGGRFEAYVQPFPGTPEQRQRLSLNGGTSPQWGRKGRELYFISGDNKLMVVAATAGDKGAIEFGTPKPLFKSPLPQGAEFDSALDGDRFLILAPVEEPPPIIVLNNWMPGGR